MSDTDARRPVLRLNEKRLTDGRAAHLLVRVAVQNEIDSRHFARDSRRDILTRHLGACGIVARWLVEASMNGHEHDVRARCANFLNRYLHRGNDVAKAQPAPDILLSLI